MEQAAALLAFIEDIQAQSGVPEVLVLGDLNAYGEEDRGNLDFDEGGQAHHECSSCAFDDDSWDPGPSRRGDVAGALLYMDLRYDGSDSGTPDLELIDRTTSIGERHLGQLSTLLVWHEEDLVDAAERRRNDVIFAWQGNRNPFVDHPEWVQSIWAGACR